MVLIRGAVPAALGAASAIALATALARRVRPGRLVGALVVAAAIVAVMRVGVAGAVDVSRIPRSFYLWAAIPLFALGAVTSMPRPHARWRWAVGGFAVLLAAGFAADEVNSWFAYFPTAADLAAQPVPGEVPAAPVLARLKDEQPRNAPPVTDGALLRLDIVATTSGFRHRAAYVWVPPAAFDRGVDPLPVVVMLAGTPGAPDNLLRAVDTVDLAKRYAMLHGGRAPLLVFPDHNGSFGADTECVDGPRGDAETYLTVDVPAFLRATFPVTPGRWGIAGFSEGGTCALTLSLRHPGLFSTYLDIAGDLRPNLGMSARQTSLTVSRLFGGSRQAWSEHDPVTLLSNGRFDGVAGRMVAGRSDRPAMEAARTLDPMARKAGIESDIAFVNGHHSFATASRALTRNFDWLARRLEPVPADLLPAEPRFAV